MATIPGEQDDEALRILGEGNPSSRRQDALLRESAFQANGLSPDISKRVLKQQFRTGIDRDVIAQFLDEIESEKDQDWEKFRRESPKMSDWMSRSKYHAAVGRADQDVFKNIERKFRRIDDTLRPMSDKDIEAEVAGAADREVERGRLALEKDEQAGRDYAIEALDRKRRIGALRPEEDTSRQFDALQEEYRAGRQARMPRKPETRDEIYKRLLATRQAEERFIADTDSIGIVEGAARGFRIPAVDSFKDSVNYVDLWRAAKAMQAGTADEDQKILVSRFARMNEAAERRGHTILGRAAEIITGLPETLVGFGATQGVYKLTKKTVEKSLQEAMKESLGGAARGLVRKAVGATVGSAVQGAAMGIPSFAGDVAERMLPGMRVTPEQSGKLKVLLDPESGDGFGAAVLKTLGSNFVQTLSERSGAGVQVPIEKTMAFLKAKVFSRTAQKLGGVDEAIEALSKTGGWNGAVGEMFEERVAEAGEAVLGITPYKPPTMEQLASELIAFGGPGAIRAGGRAIFRKRQEEEIPFEDSIFTKELIDEVKQLKSVNDAPEVVENALAKLPEGTKREFAYVDAKEFFQDFIGSKTDKEGVPIDPKALAEKLGVDARAYDQAVAMGGRVKIPTAKLLVEAARQDSPIDGAQDFVSYDPLIQSKATTEKLLKGKEALTVEKMAEATLSPERVERLAAAVARKEAKAHFEELKKTDLIAQVDKYKKDYLDEQGREADESELAYAFGEVTPERFREMLSAAKEARDAASKRIDSKIIPEHILEAVKDAEFRKKVAALSAKSEAATVKSMVKADASDEAKALAREAELEEDQQIEAELEASSARKARQAEIKESAKRVKERVSTALREAKVPLEQIQQIEKFIEAAAKTGAERYGFSLEDELEKAGLKIESAKSDDAGPGMEQPAYHGSPHKFEKFSLQKIGTGEGAQAYGWGLYFAGEKEVAKYYRDKLSQFSFSYKGRPVNTSTVRGRAIEMLFGWQGDKSSAIDDVKVYLSENISDSVRRDLNKLISEIQSIDYSKVSKAGRLYTVDIPEDGDYLDWDKPLSEWPKKASDAIRGIKPEDLGLSFKRVGEWYGWVDKSNKLIGHAYKDEAKARESGILGGSHTGRAIYGDIAKALGSEEAASKALLAAGIPGIKYADQMSRGKEGGSSNYVLFDDSLVKITGFEQPAKKGAFRGRLDVTFGDKIKLQLSELANASTFPHEFFGHFYLNMIGTIAGRENAPANLKADLADILEYLGADDWNNLTEEQHEKWSKTIERYLMEGKTPSKALRGALYRFSQWLLEIYKDIKETYFSGVELSPKITAVLDRMLATDEEIKAAREEEGVQPIFEKGKAAGLTDAQAERLAQLVAGLDARAKENITEAAMEDIRRTELAWWDDEREKMRAVVEADVDGRKVYRALSAFKTGALPDGTRVVPEGLHFKIGKGFIPETMRNLLPKEVYASDGIPPKEASELLGYESVQAMYTDLIDAIPRDRLIEDLTDERMTQEYGEPPTDQELNDLAVQALHNDDYEEMLYLEQTGMAARNPELAKALIGSLPNRPVVNERARDTVGNLMIQDLDPKLYQSAERKAAKATKAAWDKGDVDAALSARADQIWWNAMYREAVKAKTRVDDLIKKERRVARPDERLSKTHDIDYINAMRSVLASVNIGNRSKPASEYLGQLKQYDEATYSGLMELIQPFWDNRQDFQTLTVNQFADLKDALDALWDMSIRSHLAQVDGKAKKVEDIVADLSKVVDEKLSKRKEKTGYDSRKTDWEKASDMGAGLLNSLKRVEAFVEVMDGGPNGPFRTNLWNPIREAVDQYIKQKNEMDRELVGILKDVDWGKDANNEIDADEIGFTFKNKFELFGALLHLGNKSNKQKLLRGYGWGDFDPETDELESTEFDAAISRLEEEGVITEEMYNAAQKIWNLFEKYKPGLQQAHKYTQGRHFQEIEAVPFQTKYGQYKGGYVPAMADPFEEPDATVREFAGNMNETVGAIAPTVGKGSTITRKKMAKYKMQLDVRGLRRHTDWAARYTHLAPRIQDASKILRNREFSEKLSKLDPTLYSDLLKPWLDRTASQLVETPVSGKAGTAVGKFSRWLRKMTGLSFMAGNVVNAVQNITSFPLVLTKVEPKHARNALFSFMRDPKGVAKFARDNSTFMENRTDTETQAMIGELEAILLGDSPYQNFKAWAQKNAMFLQRYTQNWMDNIAWKAGYDQAKAKGEAHEEAVRQADSVVRMTQSAGGATDISRIETGGTAWRMVMQFANFFNGWGNLLGSEFAKEIGKSGLKNGAGRIAYIYMVGMMVPAVLAEMIAAASRGGLNDDDEDGYMDEAMELFFGGQAKTATAMIPGGQALRAAYGSLFTDNRYDDKISASPAISLLENVVKAPSEVYKAALDKGRSSRAVKDALSLITLFSGVPVSAISRPLEYISDMAEDVAEPTGPIDFTRGILTGKPGYKD